MYMVDMQLISLNKMYACKHIFKIDFASHSLQMITNKCQSVDFKTSFVSDRFVKIRAHTKCGVKLF